MFKYYFVFLIISSNIVHGLSEECEITEDTKPVKNEERLRDDLLCNYNKHFIPLHNRSEHMIFSIAMQIFGYDIINSVPTMLYLENEITVTWQDAFLTWNPEDYDSITELDMNTDKIWSPEIMPEELEFFAHGASILASSECKVTSSGNVSCTVTNTHSGYCTSDVRRWPYDEHTCELQYMVWSSNDEKLQCNYPSNESLTVRVSKRVPTWLITGKSTEYWVGRPQMTLSISEIYFEFRLMRNVEGGEGKMQFIFLSMFVMTSLSLMSFWTNFEATERLVVCLLNIIYHIFQIQDMEWKFPNLGHSVPYLLCFYRDSMVLAFIILVESMVFKKILTSDKPTPSWLVVFERTLGRQIIGKILLVDGITSGDPKNTEQGSFEEELKFIKESKQMEKRRTIQVIDRIIFIAFATGYFIMITILFAKLK